MHFTRVITLLAEGLSPSMPTAVAELAGSKWKRAGSPNNWLFVCVGDKTAGRNKKIHLLDCGGLAQCVVKNEANYLASLLQAQGIPFDQILIEDKASDLEEYAAYVREELYYKGKIHLDPGKSLCTTLVCHDIERWEAMVAFRHSGWAVPPPWVVPYHGDMRQPLSLWWLPRALYICIHWMRSKRYP